MEIEAELHHRMLHVFGLLLTVGFFDIGGGVLRAFFFVVRLGGGVCDFLSVGFGGRLGGGVFDFFVAAGRVFDAAVLPLFAVVFRDGICFGGVACGDFDRGGGSVNPGFFVVPLVIALQNRYIIKID